MTSLCRDSCLSCLTMRHSTLASGYRPHSSLFASFRLIASDNKSWASTSGSPVAPVDSWESMARIFSLAVNVTTQSMTVVLLNVFEHLACLWKHLIHSAEDGLQPILAARVRYFLQSPKCLPEPLQFPIWPTIKAQGLKSTPELRISENEASSTCNVAFVHKPAAMKASNAAWRIIKTLKPGTAMPIHAILNSAVWK